MVKLNDKYYGDPMDLEIFNKFEKLKDFNYDHKSSILNFENYVFKELKKFSFESANKRMGVIAE